jgi:hypothetical protein
MFWRRSFSFWRASLRLCSMWGSGERRGGQGQQQVSSQPIQAVTARGGRWVAGIPTHFWDSFIPTVPNLGFICGWLNGSPQRCSCLNSQNPWMCYVLPSVAEGVLQMSLN